MKRLMQLNARITVLLDDKINDYCDQLKLTRSDFVYKSIIFYLKNKGYKGLARLLKHESARSKAKEDNYSLYLGTNAIVTLVKMAKTSLLLTGRIDAVKIKIVIRNYKTIYNSFSPNIKAALKQEMITIEKLENPKNLKQYIYNWDLIKEFLVINKDKRTELR